MIRYADSHLAITNVQNWVTRGPPVSQYTEVRLKNDGRTYFTVVPFGLVTSFLSFSREYERKDVMSRVAGQKFPHRHSHFPKRRLSPILGALGHAPP